MHILGFLALAVIPLQEHSPAGPNRHGFKGLAHLGGQSSGHGAGHGAGAHTGTGLHGAGLHNVGLHGAGGHTGTGLHGAGAHTGTGLHGAGGHTGTGLHDNGLWVYTGAGGHAGLIGDDIGTQDLDAATVGAQRGAQTGWLVGAHNGVQDSGAGVDV